MEISKIIKESFVFPSKNLSKLAMYIILAIVVAFLMTGGLISTILGVNNFLYTILGIVLFIFALFIVFALAGFQIAIIKSGIDKVDELPDFDWNENLILGVKNEVLTIIFFIIPTIIVWLVGWATGLFAKSQELYFSLVNASLTAPANSTVIITDVVSQSFLNSLGNAFAITAIIAFILFVFFSLLKTMAEARLANTGSLYESMSFSGAFKDIGKVGWGRYIAVLILIIIVITIINLILSFLNSWIPGLIVLSVIITPYLTFFTARAVGLLYSDIA